MWIRIQVQIPSEKHPLFLPKQYFLVPRQCCLHSPGKHQIPMVMATVSPRDTGNSVWRNHSTWPRALAFERKLIPILNSRFKNRIGPYVLAMPLFAIGLWSFGEVVLMRCESEVKKGKSGILKCSLLGTMYVCSQHITLPYHENVWPGLGGNPLLWALFPSPEK